MMNIGVDIACFSEFTRILQSEKYKHFIFTDNELSLAAKYPMNRQLEFLVGRFCAKEATVKALGSGFLQEDMIKWEDIETLRDEKGAPIAVLHNNAKDIFYNKGYKEIKLSISHKKKVVICSALLY